MRLLRLGRVSLIAHVFGAGALGVRQAPVGELRLEALVAEEGVLAGLDGLLGQHLLELGEHRLTLLRLRRRLLKRLFRYRIEETTPCQRHILR